jgi:gliding motility-associated-like protein
MVQFLKQHVEKGFLFGLLFIQVQFSNGQACIGGVSIFPYSENFESSNGNWFTGGVSSDWAWGSPTKTVISGAGGAAKCWIAGGLSNAAYNNSENSWLQSPCFDFSTLQYPQISFKVFWETEKRFDGASIQYSTDLGNTWTYLGNANSNSNCSGENWFNATSITYLSNANGWSGNIQPSTGSCLVGSGSGSWLTAKHSLSMLAGQSNVRFRFLFGAGSTCNAYDGFAIDDVQISESQPNAVSFTHSCVSDKEILFTSVASCTSSYSWNFSDLASGANNTSSGANPSHIFSGPGTYNVTLTTNFVTGPATSLSKEIVIIALDTTIRWPGICSNLADATLSVNATGSNTAYFYNWSTTPSQTGSSISNIGPGAYSATVSSMNACTVTANFTLTTNTPIVINAIVTDAGCSADNGSIKANVTGGKSPYRFTWTNGSDSSAAVQLFAGNYSVGVTDAYGCGANSGILVVKNILIPVSVNLGNDISICPGETVILTPGAFSKYLWQDYSTNPSFSVSASGTYFVQVKNAAGCSGSDTISVAADCSDIYFPNAITPNGDTKNDGFGPLGNLSLLTDYQLSVYNRYGQCIFNSYIPNQKWDGAIKGSLSNNGTFVWVAQFLINGKPKVKKGTVTILR